MKNYRQIYLLQMIWLSSLFSLIAVLDQCTTTPTHSPPPASKVSLNIHIFSQHLLNSSITSVWTPSGDNSCTVHVLTSLYKNDDVSMESNSRRFLSHCHLSIFWLFFEHSLLIKLSFHLKKMGQRQSDKGGSSLLLLHSAPLSPCTSMHGHIHADTGCKV